MIFGFRDHQSGEQRSDDRRQADGRGCERGDDDDEQTGGEEQFGVFRPRGLREDSRQQEPAADGKRRDDDRALPQGGEQQLGIAAPGIWRKGAKNEDDRDDRQILEQQHRKRRAADRGLGARDRQNERRR